MFKFMIITGFSVGLSTTHPTFAGLTTKNKNITKPTKPMYKPGIMKDNDQSVSTYSADIKLPEKKGNLLEFVVKQ